MIQCLSVAKAPRPWAGGLPAAWAEATKATGAGCDPQRRHAGNAGWRGWVPGAEPPAAVSGSKASARSAPRGPGTRHTAGQRACQPARRRLERVLVQRQHRLGSGRQTASAQDGALPAEEPEGAGALPWAVRGSSSAPSPPAALAGQPRGTSMALPSGRGSRRSGEAEVEAGCSVPRRGSKCEENGEEAERRLLFPGCRARSSEVRVVESLQSCPTLRPRDGSPPGSSVRGIPQARLEGLGCHLLHRGPS